MPRDDFQERKNSAATTRSTSRKPRPRGERHDEHDAPGSQDCTTAPASSPEVPQGGQGPVDEDQPVSRPGAPVPTMDS